jgi:hypothetical protein
VLPCRLKWPERPLRISWQKPAKPDLADALALTFAYPVAAHDHRWQLTGKPRHQYQHDPFQQARTGPL